MSGSVLGIANVILILALISLCYAFLNMWTILYGTWFKIIPIWRFFDEFKKLKELSKNAESYNLRKKCKTTFYALYISLCLFFLAMLISNLQ